MRMHRLWTWWPLQSFHPPSRMRCGHLERFQKSWHLQTLPSKCCSSPHRMQSPHPSAWLLSHQCLHQMSSQPIHQNLLMQRHPPFHPMRWQMPPPPLCLPALLHWQSALFQRKLQWMQTMHPAPLRHSAAGCLPCRLLSRPPVQGLSRAGLWRAPRRDSHDMPSHV